MIHQLVVWKKLHRLTQEDLEYECREKYESYLGYVFIVLSELQTIEQTNNQEAIKIQFLMFENSSPIITLQTQRLHSLPEVVFFFIFVFIFFRVANGARDPSGSVQRYLRKRIVRLVPHYSQVF